MLKLFQKNRISVKFKIVCLRPKKDFTDNGVKTPSIFDVFYFEKFNANSVELIQNADVLILPAVGEVIDTKVFEKSSIKLIQVTGAGFDRVDEKKLRKLNINVCNVTGANSNSVAEYCIGNAISLLRSIKIADKLIGLGKFSEVRKQIIEEDLFELQGLNACFIGLGPIGACVAGYFHKFGCKIFCNDIKPLEKKFLNSLGAHQITLEDVLATGDIISILHSDDFYFKYNSLEIVSQNFQQYDSEIIFGDIIYLKNKNQIFRYWESCDFKKGSFQKGWSPPHPGFFVKKEIYFLEPSSSNI